MYSNLRALAVLLAVVAVPRTASAQFESETAPRFSVPVAAWGSVGLGPGNPPDHRSGVAGIVRANASAGPFLLGYRYTDAGPFISAGSGVREKGVLAGVRTGGHRLFGSAALGYARSTPYYQSDNNGPTDSPSAGVLAYDATVHANAYVVGLALSLSGGIGRSNVTYSAVTLSLEAGWFGW